jgi:hypothetical protein
MEIAAPPHAGPAGPAHGDKDKNDKSSCTTERCGDTQVHCQVGGDLRGGGLAMFQVVCLGFLFDKLRTLGVWIDGHSVQID